MNNIEGNLKSVLDTLKNIKNIDFDTLTESSFNNDEWKIFYIVEPTIGDIGFHAVVTVQYKGVRVFHWGCIDTEENRFVIDFFKRIYGSSWSKRSKWEQETKLQAVEEYSKLQVLTYFKS